MDEDNDRGNGSELAAVWGDGFAWEVVGSLGQGVTIIDADFHFAYVNPAYAQMVGRLPEDLIGLSPFAVTHPEDHGLLQQVIQQRLSGKQSSYETRLVQPDGTIVYAHITGVPRREGGQIVGTFSIITDLTAHKQTEKKLRQSEERYRRVVEDQTDFIVRWLPDGTRLFVNEAYCQHFGQTKEEMVGSSFFPLIYEEDRAAIRTKIASLTPENPIAEDEHRSILRDGSIRWHRWVDRAFFNEHGRIVELQSVGRDITEQKKAETALQQLTRRLQLTLDHLTVVAYEVDEEGTFLLSRGKGLEKLGLQPDEVVGLSIFDVYAEYPLIIAAVHRALAGEVQRFEVEVNGVVWDANFIPIMTEQGEVKRLFGTAIDVTQWRQAERALRQSKTELQHVIDTVPEGVLLLGAGGSIHLANPVADQYLTKLMPERENGRLTHLGNRSLPELLRPPPRGLWHEIACENSIFEAIARPVENSLRNDSWVLVLRDVTQERDIQRRAQRQERLAAVGQLAAGIAHDFNNILAVISLYTQIIARMAEIPAPAQERLHTIEQQTKRATDLIQQVLDFSRQSVLERQPLDLLTFVENVVTLLERTLPEHIQIELTHAAGPYFILADPSRMQQVMMNLAINARDAMPEGGRLQIRLSHVQTGKFARMPVRDMPPGNWIEMAVSDSGSGISLEVLSHVFEPFFTTKEVGQGTGLGLAQVYGIVQQHKGYIDVATKVGRGTTFLLYFPTLNTGENSLGKAHRSALQLGQGQRILVVEDDPATREALLDSLALLNYEVMAATNGREALALLATQAGGVDLVLSDVVMPEMGGIALFHAMREQNLAIPVVFLTGHPLSNKMEEQPAPGLAGWLPKPPDLVNLSALLAEVLSA